MNSTPPALLAVVLIAHATPVLAQPPAAPPPDAPSSQAPAADALYEEGRKALAAGDVEGACNAFRASDQLDPGAGVRAALAACEEKRGHLTVAWEGFKVALKRLPPGDARAAKIETRIAELEKRIPRLVLVRDPSAHAPEDTAVMEGSARIGTVGAWAVPLPIDPGPHRLFVSAPGRPSRTVDVVLVEGETLTVAVAPGDVVGAGAARPVSPTKGLPAGVWTLGGVGAAGLVAALAAGIVTAQKRAAAWGGCSMVTMTCTPAGKAASDQGQVAGAATVAGLVVGSAALAGAGIWAGLGSKKASARIGIAGTGLAVEGSW